MGTQKQPKQVSLLPEPTWRCKDGRVLTVGEMTTSHQINCLRMLSGRYAMRQMMALELSMIAYAGNAPDGASACAEGEANSLSIQSQSAEGRLAFLIEQCEHEPIVQRLWAAISAKGVTLAQVADKCWRTEDLWWLCPPKVQKRLYAHAVAAAQARTGRAQ